MFVRWNEFDYLERNHRRMARRERYFMDEIRDMLLLRNERMDHNLKQIDGG